MNSIAVRPARSSEQLFALTLLWSEADDPSGQAEETFAAAHRGEFSLSELVVAELAGEIVGAGFFTEQPGRVGFVWPPGLVCHSTLKADVCSAILSAIACRLDELKLCIGQVILDPDRQAMRELLDRNGFPHLTDLHYMVCPANPSSLTELPREIGIETFDPLGNAHRFAQVLQQTYIGTLDCPELDGLRSAEDALAAHQGTGRFHPETWWLFQHQNRDAGLLLLNEHPERELLEIVYLGVVPEKRGKGLGRFLVEWAISEANRANQSLVLAVDARNHPARNIYQRAGFLDVTVQSVHLRQARANGPIS